MEQCTATFDTHVVHPIGFSHYFVVDRYTSFMLSHSQSWASSKAIKLEPSTAYHPQTGRQSEIVLKEIIQGARGCKAAEHAWLGKIPKMQLKLSSHYNTSSRNNLFVTVLHFDTKLRLHIFPYPINNYHPAVAYNSAISKALTDRNTSQFKQANWD